MADPWEIKRRIVSPNYNRMRADVPDQYAMLMAQLAPTVAAQVLLSHGQENDEIYEFLSNTSIMQVFDKTTSLWTMVGKSCQIGMYIAQVALAANRFVILNGGNADLPGSDFAETIGVTMNAAAMGQRVYVMEIGKWYVEEADQGVPLTVGLPVATDANGRAIAMDFSSPNRYYAGQKRRGVVVGGLHCALLNVAQPVLH